MNKDTKVILAVIGAVSAASFFLYIDLRRDMSDQFSQVEQDEASLEEAIKGATDRLQGLIDQLKQSATDPARVQALASRMEQEIAAVNQIGQPAPAPTPIPSPEPPASTPTG